MRSFLFLAAIAIGLAGCAVNQPYATDEQIAAVSYRDPGPAYLRLYTMVNNRTGGGGHSALMINGSQRVIFDPAGSFYSAAVPERNDVLFGITPGMAQGYRSAHARSTYHVEMQTIQVTPEQAEIALQRVMSYGAVPAAYCANATSRVLKSIPGFEAIDVTMYPTKLAAQFERIPGVTTERYYEDDSPDLQKALEKQNEQFRSTN